MPTMFFLFMPVRHIATTQNLGNTPEINDIIIYLKNLPMLYHQNDRAINFYIELCILHSDLTQILSQQKRRLCFMFT